MSAVFGQTLENRTGRSFHKRLVRDELRLGAVPVVEVQVTAGALACSGDVVK